MDQAKSACEELSWNLTQCCDDPALNRLVCLSGAGVSEVSVETWTLHAADVAVITVKSVRTARFHGAVRTAKQKKIVM